MSVPSQENQQRRRKGRAPRVKHVPVRTCVVCRESGAKRELTRIVRTPDGDVQIDLTGRMNGRGAYLCDKATCWERATVSNALARALNIELTPEMIAALTEFAASHVLAEQQGQPGADSKESEQ